MAVADYFLKIDGIEGESLDAKHSKEIEILSWSWGETQSGSFATGSGGGSGKVSMHDFSFQKYTDKASPKLMLACAGGDHIKQAILTCRKAGKDQQEYLVVKFSDILVSSYQTGGHGEGDVRPLDSIALNFAKIEFDYKEQKADGTLGGSIKTGWDLKANKKV